MEPDKWDNCSLGTSMNLRTRYIDTNAGRVVLEYLLRHTYRSHIPSRYLQYRHRLLPAKQIQTSLDIMKQNICILYESGERQNKKNIYV